MLNVEKTYSLEQISHYVDALKKGFGSLDDTNGEEIIEDMSDENNVALRQMTGFDVFMMALFDNIAAVTDRDDPLFWHAEETLNKAADLTIEVLKLSLGEPSFAGRLKAIGAMQVVHLDKMGIEFAELVGRRITEKGTTDAMAREADLAIQLEISADTGSYSMVVEDARVGLSSDQPAMLVGTLRCLESIQHDVALQDFNRGVVNPKLPCTGIPGVFLKVAQELTKHPHEAVREAAMDAISALDVAKDIERERIEQAVLKPLNRKAMLANHARRWRTEQSVYILR